MSLEQQILSDLRAELKAAGIVSGFITTSARWFPSPNFLEFWNGDNLVVTPNRLYLYSWNGNNWISLFEGYLADPMVFEQMIAVVKERVNGPSVQPGVDATLSR